MQRYFSILLGNYFLLHELCYQVELTPPGPGDMGGLVRGVGGLVKDVATFKWAQV